HAPLVFAGDRSAELAARMRGTACHAGGIATTVAATRAATDEQLRANLGGLRREMLGQGITTFECKSGYGLTVADERRSVALAAEVTPEVTFLGAHVVPPEFAADRGGDLDLVCGPMLAGCAAPAGWGGVGRGGGPRGAHRRSGRRAGSPGARRPAGHRAGRPGRGGAWCRVRGPLHLPHRRRRGRAGRWRHCRHAAPRGGVLHQEPVP